MIDPKQEITLTVSDRVGRELIRRAEREQQDPMELLKLGNLPVGWFQVTHIAWQRGMGDCWQITLRGVGELA